MQGTMQVTIETAVQFNTEAALAQRAADEATARRNDAVLALLDSGVIRQAALAERLGVTPGRVSQIAAAARRRQRDERKAAINTTRIPNVEAA